jgi:outer membrane protein OmpA-like peptidoglycan-associated protein/Tfp pilus assembly protein PilF
MGIMRGCFGPNSIFPSDPEARPDARIALTQHHTLHFMMKSLLVCILLACTWTWASGQATYPSTTKKEALRVFKEGQAFAARNELPRAKAFFGQAVKLDAGFVDAWLALGELEAETQNWTAAAHAYNKALDLDADYAAVAAFRVAQMEWEAQQYDKVVDHCNKVIQRGKTGNRDYWKAIRLQQQAQFVLEAMQSPVPFSPINLGAGVNTANNEYFPALTADGESLVITRANAKGSYQNEDFYLSQLADTVWQEAKPISEINTPENEGAQAISPDGTWLVFTACNRTGDGSQGRCDLYWSQLKRDGWTKPVPFSSTINSEHWESQPSISADGRSIIFASNRPGGFGQGDLWLTTRDSLGKWSAPTNLGPLINTGGQEGFPYLHPDGQTLYFASDSLPGMGKFDLFVARKLPDGTWGNPVNLGYPINSRLDDTGLTAALDGKKAYFASERPEGFGGTDIYAFELPPNAQPQPTTFAKITVKDAESGQRLSAKVDVINLQTRQVFTTAVTRKDGTALVCLPVGHAYMLNVNRPEYLFYSDNFNLTEQARFDKPFQITALLTPLSSKTSAANPKPVVLRNVFFNTGSAELNPESFPELDRLTQALQQSPHLNIRIDGHTDSVGDASSNKILSENRAKSVYNYLIKQGIQANRLQYQGFGETVPVADNQAEEGRKQNRRTEITLL